MLKIANKKRGGNPSFFIVTDKNKKNHAIKPQNKQSKMDYALRTYDRYHDDQHSGVSR